MILIPIAVLLFSRARSGAANESGVPLQPDPTPTVSVTGLEAPNGGNEFGTPHRDAKPAAGRTTLESGRSGSESARRGYHRLPNTQSCNSAGSHRKAWMPRVTNSPTQTTSLDAKASGVEEVLLNDTGRGAGWMEHGLSGVRSYYRAH